MPAQLRDSQLQALVITERVNSCLSMTGILFVLATYMFSSHFNKPINRLIFFATWGNIGSTVASLISEAGPLAGAASPLCQFQAFLVQSKYPEKMYSSHWQVHSIGYWPRLLRCFEL